jgi:hypothetical protein
VRAERDVDAVAEESTRTLAAVRTASTPCVVHAHVSVAEGCASLLCTPCTLSKGADDAARASLTVPPPPLSLSRSLPFLLGRRREERYTARERMSAVTGAAAAAAVVVAAAAAAAAAAL